MWPRCETGEMREFALGSTACGHGFCFGSTAAPEANATIVPESVTSLTLDGSEFGNPQLPLFEGPNLVLSTRTVWCLKLSLPYRLSTQYVSTGCILG